MIETETKMQTFVHTEREMNKKKSIIHPTSRIENMTNLEKKKNFSAWSVQALFNNNL